MYRIWYYQDSELNMTTCGPDGEYAWKLLTYFFNPPIYHPYLEYERRAK